jgi:hypothetical protein
LAAKEICNSLQHLYAEDKQDETKGKFLSQQRSHDLLTHEGTMLRNGLKADIQSYKRV